MTRDDQERPVLVTGASGFIGARVAQHLLARGHLVRAMMRKPPANPDPGLEIVIADVMNAPSCEAAAKGCGAVIHTASGAPEIITEGTKHMLAASNEARFVHLSSVDVYGAADGSFAEAAPLPTQLSPYGAAKRAAEALCQKAAADGANVVILRPGIVTGSGSKLWVEDIAEGIAAGRATSMGSYGMGHSEPIHWHDLARAIEAVLSLPQSEAAQVFNVSGAERISWNDYLTALAKARGLPERPLGSLAFRAQLALGLACKLARKFKLPLTGPTIPTLSELAVFKRKADFPTDALEAATGWRAEMSLDAIFAEIAAPRQPQAELSQPSAPVRMSA